MTSGIGDTGPTQGYSTLSVRHAVSQWGEFPLHSPSVRCHIQPSHSSACVCKCVTAGFCSLTFLHGAERQWAQLRGDRAKNPHSNPPPPPFRRTASLWLPPSIGAYLCLDPIEDLQFQELWGQHPSFFSAVTWDSWKVELQGSGTLSWSESWSSWERGESGLHVYKFKLQLLQKFIRIPTFLRKSGAGNFSGDS